MKVSPSTWAEIDLKAIKHNFKEAKKLVRRNRSKSTRLLTVVKADAYGHGMIKVAKLLNKLGTNFFGVSDITEGITLRESGIKKPILIFENTFASYAKEIVNYKLTPTVCTLGLAKALNRYAKSKRRKIDIHIKVDTGMGRLGIWHTDAYEFIKEIMGLPYLSIKGIYTHFPVADTDRKFTKAQVDQLYSLIKRLDEQALIVPYIHAANSMGLAGYKTHILNLSRPGLMLYGLYPSSRLRGKVKLKPALTIKSKIIFLKKIKKGRSLSYGRTFIAKKGMTVATIPIGYNDGYWRVFSNKAAVLVSGERCPVLGRVTMDQIIVDVTKVKNVKLSTEVVVLGKQRKREISADELSSIANTINYEVVCSLGSRLPKEYKS